MSSSATETQKLLVGFSRLVFLRFVSYTTDHFALSSFKCGCQLIASDDALTHLTEILITKSNIRI